MSDPLALLPLALAAGGGRLNHIEIARPIAAGFTLLQRCAPLVRALEGRRAAAVLPAGPELLCALSASDGRGLVWIDPGTSREVIAEVCARRNVGAIFTRKDIAQAHSPAPAPDLPVVLLDDAPTRAQVHAGERLLDVDLGSHFGLSLEGDREAEGREEECLLLGDRICTHRELLAEARAFGRSSGLTPVDRTLTLMPAADVDLFVAGVVAPLLYGGAVHVTDVEDRRLTDSFAPTRLVSSGDDLEPRLGAH